MENITVVLARGVQRTELPTDIFNVKWTLGMFPPAVYYQSNPYVLYKGVGFKCTPISFPVVFDSGVTRPYLRGGGSSKMYGAGCVEVPRWFPFRGGVPPQPRSYATGIELYEDIRRTN